MAKDIIKPNRQTGGEGRISSHIEVNGLIPVKNEKSNNLMCQ